MLTRGKLNILVALRSQSSVTVLLRRVYVYKAQKMIKWPCGLLTFRAGLQVQRSCSPHSSSVRHQQKLVSLCCPWFPEWHLARVTEGQSSFLCPGSGDTFIPSQLQHSPSGEGSQGTALANIVTPLPQSPLAWGQRRIPPLSASSSEGKDRIPFLLKLWRCNWIFF